MVFFTHQQALRHMSLTMTLSFDIELTFMQCICIATSRTTAEQKTGGGVKRTPPEEATLTSWSPSAPPGAEPSHSRSARQMLSRDWKTNKQTSKQSFKSNTPWVVLFELLIYQRFLASTLYHVSVHVHVHTKVSNILNHAVLVRYECTTCTCNV